ncbi:MAG: class I SAM-dependent methyltransferase [Patescibacteria group bacterium]
MQIKEILLSSPLYKPSESENDGLSLVKESDLHIYCPGISTGGFTEISMALDDKKRQIIATTLDEKGIQETQKLIEQYGVQSQITLKLEDVSEPLPYENESFDFIYARLVLHYLSKQRLEQSLKELHRILKKGAQIFIVVRSFDWESEVTEKKYDSETGITSYPEYDSDGNILKFVERGLQTEDSITSALVTAEFRIQQVRKLEETIYGGYLRIRPNKKPSKLIEVVAIK